MINIDTKLLNSIYLKEDHYTYKNKTQDLLKINKNKLINEDIKIMLSSYLPSILVSLVGLVFPAIAIVYLFLYIEQDDIV